MRPQSRSLPETGRTRRLKFLATLAVLLLLLLLFLAGPVRTAAVSYGTGAIEASRITIVNLLKGPARVGLQIGHLDAHLHPAEHASLRWNFGGHAAGLDELDVNIAVAAELKKLLEAAGVTVELLPASVPPHYSADAILSLHADSVEDTARNGYKSAFFEPARNNRDALLKQHVDDAYLSGSGLRDDSVNTSGTMVGYYAFNPRFLHSVNPRSPALLVEMGYISHPGDRAFLLEPAEPAALLAEGVLEYLSAIQRVPPGGH